MHIITEYFVSSNPDRQSEYLTCLRHNLNLPGIVKIHLFITGECEPPYLNEKIMVHKVSGRPTYGQLIDFCSTQLSGEICAITNADIMFDSSIGLLNKQNIAGKFLALSRWDLGVDGRLYHYDWDYSQDCWIFLSPVLGFRGGDYTMGVLGCDNSIAYDAANNGFRVINPSWMIRTIHLHNSQHRTYNPSEILNRSYLFVSSTHDLDTIPETVLTDPSTIGQAVAHVRKRKMERTI